MKKFMLFLLAVTAAILVLSNLGPMIPLAGSLALTYYAVKKFILTDGLTEKILWGFVILIGLSISLANVPAFIGAAAVVIFYYAYKAWKEDKAAKVFDMDEPCYSKSEFRL